MNKISIFSTVSSQNYDRITVQKVLKSCSIKKQIKGNKQLLRHSKFLLINYYYESLFKSYV